MLEVIYKAVKIMYGEKDNLLKDMRMVGDGVMGGEPRAFQQDMDITNVAAPSYNTIRWMSFRITVT